MAEEISAIEAGVLTLTLDAELPIDWEAQPATVGWPRSRFNKWMGAGQDTTGMYFPLTICVRPSPGPGDGGACRQFEHGDEPQPTCTDNCRNVLVFREPVDAVAVARAASEDYGADNNKVLARQALPVPQWGQYSYLPLSAGFGKSKTFAFGMNEFGRISSFTWKTGARAESISGSVADIVGAANSLATNLRSSDVQANERRIKELETQKKLNELELCAATITAGGYVCPKPATE